MAGEALFIGWGEVVRGREAKSLEVFQEAIEFWGRQMQEGNIESVEPVFLQPHGGDLGGFLLIKGDPEKLDEISRSDEFDRVNTRATFVVDRLGIVGAVTGEALGEAMQIYQEAISDLGG